MSAPKYYVVWKGHKPGVYPNWEECKAMVEGFTGALYKSFPSRLEAENAFKDKAHLHIQKKTQTRTSLPSSIIRDSICVDGAWNTATGDMEYRGVYLLTGEEIFRKGPYFDGTNNIGEFLAIVHALALLEKKGHKKPVYSDSRTAIAWVRNKRANTKLQPTGRNDELFDLIARAENWLREHNSCCPVLKWETSLWGEIPADFGRK